MITIKKLAELANVSTTTVSNVIHGKTAKVSAEKEAEIKNLIKEYNYVPNMGLRVLSKKSSHIIGVIIFTHNSTDHLILKGPHHIEIISVLERLLHEHDYSMMLYSSDNVDDIYRLVGGWNMDGVIALSCDGSDYQKLAEITNKPIVAIDIQSEPDCFSYQVGIDNSLACYKMIHLLLKRGYTNFRIFFHKDLGLEHKRWQGCWQALRESGISNPETCISFLGNTKQDRKTLYLNLASTALPDEVWVFFSDENALEAMGFLQNNGFAVPGQISVVGFDDIDIAENSYPGLTTVHQDIDKKARLAGEMLLQRIQNLPVDEAKIVLLLLLQNGHLPNILNQDRRLPYIYPDTPDNQRGYRNRRILHLLGTLFIFSLHKLYT